MTTALPAKAELTLCGFARTYRRAEGSFEDGEHQQLMKAKGNQSRHDFIMTLIEANDEAANVHA